MSVMAWNRRSEVTISPTEFKRRNRAARELAGIRSHSELAARIDQRNLSASNIRAMERGERPLYRSDLFAIAEACGLPLAWFEVDIADALAAYAVSQLPADPAAELERELEEEADQQDDTHAGSNEEDDRAEGGQA